VDSFTRQSEMPRYARMVPLSEIADPKNDYNLNLPRYIESSEPEDLQDIDGHLRGGIPERDLDAPDNPLAAYWKVLPGVRTALFESAGRPSYAKLKLPVPDIKAAIFGHPEFTDFNQHATGRFEGWRSANVPLLQSFDEGGHPKALIEKISESLLKTFKPAPLLDAYDIYQHLMNYWAEVLQDDAYLISTDGWVKGAQPREIVQVKDKNNKLVWPEPHDYLKGKRRFKSDLVPAAILIGKYFADERDALDALDSQLSTLEQQLDELREEQCGEDGLLAEANEANVGEPPKINAKSLNAALKKVSKTADDADERNALLAYSELLEQYAATKAKRKAAQEELDAKIDAKYPNLTEPEVKTLVVADKWMVRLSAAVQGELDRCSQTLTGRIRELAERYAVPLHHLNLELNALAARVDEHLKRMGASWE
jgi:type I restriction enzyme M protein